MTLLAEASKQKIARTSTEITHVCALIFKQVETNRSPVWKPVRKIK